MIERSANEIRPQRDVRLGYGFDLDVFAPAAYDLLPPHELFTVCGELWARGKKADVTAVMWFAEGWQARDNA